jgi:hypothetical protein
MYQYHESFGNGPTAVRVSHSCGHTEIYDFGGTAEYFAPRRQAFAAAQSLLPCPTCSGASLLAESAAIELPVIDDEYGAGTLRTDLPGYEGKPILALDKPVLAEGFTADTSYKFAVRLATQCRYIHRRRGIAYSPEQEAWVDEYAVCGHSDKQPGWYERFQRFGGSFGHDPKHIAAAEARMGCEIPLNSVRLPDGTIIGEDAEAEDDRIAIDEAALELAVEEGILSGAMPADI